MVPETEPASPEVAWAMRLSSLAVRALDDLEPRIHPGWRAELAVDRLPLSDGGAAAMNAVLRARFDLCWPDLSAARHGIELAWLLEPGQVARLCAARALFACRGTLARTVDAAQRRAARALIGSEVVDAMIELPERHRDDAALPPMETPGLVAAGWQLLRAQLRWSDERSRRLMELALPPEAASPGLRDGGVSADAHRRFLNGLHQLFPEHQWLFGSRRASSTSA